MKGKKIALVVLCFLTIIFLYISKHINNIPIQSVMVNHNSINYSRLDALNVAMKNEPQIAKSYGGTFIDSKGILYVYIVGNDNVKKLTSMLKDNKIVCKKVKYTYEQLKNTLNSLSNNLVRFNIKQASLNISKNTVEVYLNQDNTETKKKILNSLKEATVTFVKSEK